MGRWSPECTGGKWVGGATGPAVGARFKGSNRHGVMRWTTHCRSRRPSAGKAFEWEVKESGHAVGLPVRAAPATARSSPSTASRRSATPFYIKLVQQSGLIGRNREQLLVDGMRQTLERLKAAAEA